MKVLWYNNLRFLFRGYYGRVKKEKIETKKKEKINNTVNNCKNDYEYIILLSVDKDCKDSSLVNVTINETLRNVTYYDKNTTYSVSPGYLDSYILKDDIIKSGETLKYDLKFGLNESKSDLEWIAEIKVIGLAK